MSESPQPSAVPPAAGSADQPPARPSLTELLHAFVQVSLSAFGGALPWSRRMIVERKGWMSGKEFNETFALSQFLPGPNTINFAVVFGSRFGGVGGAVVAVVGLIGPPLAIVLVLAYFYERYGDAPVLDHVLAGIAASACGLLIAAVAKMAAPLFSMKRLRAAPLIAILAFVGVAVMHWPLPYVFLALAPVSIALAWFEL
ncbi:MAG: chromate transporter [Pseudolabrys sp.]